jgi:protein TonB
MKAAQAVAIGAAIVLHAGAILFGGLLLFRHGAKREAADEQVEIVAEEAKPEATKEEPQKEIDEQKEAAPETTPQLAAQDAPPLDLSQLEMALNPGGDGLGGDFVSRARALNAASGAAQEAQKAAMQDEVFSIADLDQVPRVVYQPPPEFPPELRRKKTAGAVYVVFVVDRAGRVTNPAVQKSTNAALDQAALTAVKRWRFEPGKRAGQPVPFKMRAPITFSSG